MNDHIDVLAVLPRVDVVGLMTELTNEAGVNALGLQINSARAAVAELIEAAAAFDKTYAWHWDRVDGAAVIMPDRVDEFEARAERLTKAIARVK